MGVGGLILKKKKTEHFKQPSRLGLDKKSAKRKLPSPKYTNQDDDTLSNFGSSNDYKSSFKRYNKDVYDNKPRIYFDQKQANLAKPSDHVDKGSQIRAQIRKTYSNLDKSREDKFTYR